MKEREKVFGEDDLSARAISAFGQLRNVQIKHIGTDRKDDAFTFRKINGQMGEYILGGLMECDEFVDFVKGYKGMSEDKLSESYIQGQGYRKD